ncbi:hypothetical protein PDE_06466 [Penicillium oxalicum 114-2]|uniref:Yeast cell wall synthesis Kre9/Knh1-like N-terminal domain-containing protein n=1 Tax=Penicillium oxalicum (strain 114-2 / CGMCC 5302) TaxID=933388 RepID=S7ZS28_PENO1|nr:hypothetical protein PDE_06466 [Penicillium oxalicum 114-2]
MRFTSFLAASASLFAVVYANAPLAFTAWPSDIQAGKPVTLTWEGGAPDQPVTLMLRKGASTDLQDVQIITAQGRDGTFTWTPGDNVKAGEDYAFQITQGGERNYSALLKAGPPVNPEAAVQSTTQTTMATGMTTGLTTDMTRGFTTATNTVATTMTQQQSVETGTISKASATNGTAPQTSATTSKPLISMQTAKYPSSSVFASMTATNASASQTVQSSFMEPHASETGVIQSNNASPLASYSKLAMSAMGMLAVYLAQ